MGIPYDSQEAINLADRLMAFSRKSPTTVGELARARHLTNWDRSIYRKTSAHGAIDGHDDRATGTIR